MKKTLKAIILCSLIAGLILCGIAIPASAIATPTETQVASNDDLLIWVKN